VLHLRTAHYAGHQAQSGFTLVETVVALAILALALGVLYESFGWSLRRTSKIEKQELAWLAAQSILAEIRSRGALRVGVERGDAPPGLKWRSRIDVLDNVVDPRHPLKPFEVTIEVSWGNRPAQHVRLQSVEIGRIAS
jgi:general secretion pathway protein I